MTLRELETTDKMFLRASDIAEIVGSDPQDIRNQAKNGSELLGFPVTIVGKNVKIPRLPFLKFIKGE